jgi:hypothetical protein
MALSENNPLLKGARGTLGGTIVIKQYGNKIVLSNYPDMSKVKPSILQQEKRRNFKNAVAYEKSISDDPKKRAAYKNKLKKNQTVFLAAISEYMKTHK